MALALILEGREEGRPAFCFCLFVLTPTLKDGIEKNIL